MPKWTNFSCQRHLRHGAVRTGELMRTVGGISQKMLTQTLRDLERNGLVERTSYPEVPPRVEYRLTKTGVSLSRQLSQLEVWVRTHFDYMLEAQRRADRHPKNGASVVGKSRTLSAWRIQGCMKT